MRCGYHPDQYPTELEWDARLMIELSLAIKSPSIHYHLAGTKKVQQELAKEGILEKYLGDKAQMDSVRDIFALWITRSVPLNESGYFQNTYF